MNGLNKTLKILKEFREKRSKLFPMKQTMENVFDFLIEIFDMNVDMSKEQATL